MLSNLYLSVKHFFQRRFNIAQQQSPHEDKVTVETKERTNDLDMEMLSMSLKNEISSEYPFSFIGEILEVFQLEHVNDTSQSLEDVHKDFIDFLIQQRPAPNFVRNKKPSLTTARKPVKSEKLSSVQSWNSESELDTKTSSERESSEYSIIHTDDENIQNAPLPRISLPGSQKPHHETGFTNANTMWVSIE